MVFIKSADGVIFADENLEEIFNSLPENDPIKKSIVRAIKNLKEDAFCGERIRKELIPRVYIQKYKIDNLLWYPLPDGWRLVYSIQRDEVELLAVILEWFDHKDYERRFNY
jgi:Txe/YoeB family toxin of Txe-Axe toxin-antitoxin module